MLENTTFLNHSCKFLYLGHYSCMVFFLHTLLIVQKTFAEIQNTFQNIKNTVNDAVNAISPNKDNTTNRTFSCLCAGFFIFK